MASLIPMLALLVVGASAILCLLSVPRFKQALMDKLSVSFGFHDDEPAETDENDDPNDTETTSTVNRERECFDTSIFRE